MKERQIGNFEFWHDRLVMLKQAFDEADPKTVRQYVHKLQAFILAKANVVVSQILVGPQKTCSMVQFLDRCRASRHLDVCIRSNTEY